MTRKDNRSMPRRVPVRLVLFTVAALIIAALLTACSASSDDTPQTTIDPAGPAGQVIQDIYALIWWLALVVFILVEGALVYAIIRFRRGKKTVEGRPAPVHGNTRLEIIWTVIPAIILVIIAVPTIQGIADMADRDDDAFHVRVIGNQFFWEFEYPDIIGPDGEPLKVVDTMHIPVDTRIEITLESNDVIHSFWVPRLAGKTDAIPGRRNHMWMQAAETGIYEGQCAEFCGLAHADMRFTVVADTAAEFDTWAATQLRPPDDPVAAGRQIIETMCAACHIVEGTSATTGTIGPELTDFPSQPDIAGVLENNEENLRMWLADPPGVKPGTQMPNLGLSPQQIDALVAFFSSLGEPGEQ